MNGFVERYLYSLLARIFQNNNKIKRTHQQNFDAEAFYCSISVRLYDMISSLLI